MDEIINELRQAGLLLKEAAMSLPDDVPVLNKQASDPGKETAKAFVGQVMLNHYLNAGGQ